MKYGQHRARAIGGQGGLEVFTVDYKGGIWLLCCTFSGGKAIRILDKDIHPNLSS